MPVARSRASACLLVLIAAFALPACGSAPEGSVDVAFVELMTLHHEEGVKMAKAARKEGDSAFVRSLGARMAAKQSRELEKLEDAGDRLAGEAAGDLGVPRGLRGMGHDAHDAEGPFDREWVDMMVDHHQGAIRMAYAVGAEGKDDDLKKLAKAIVRTQSREIKQMNAFRTARFGAPSPMGGVPEDEHHDENSGSHGAEGSGKGAKEKKRSSGGHDGHGDGSDGHAEGDHH